MTQRLLVLNGFRLLQSKHAGEWVVDKVDKAGAIKPGIYNIYLATPADKTKAHDGIMLYADKQFVYQQTGQNFVWHDQTSFRELPEIGASCKIRYENEEAIVSKSSRKPIRK